MNRFFFFGFLFVFALTATILGYGCAGSSGDDDDEDLAAEGTTIKGTLSYGGQAEGDIVVIGYFEEWPPTTAPKWLTEVAVPDSGFPFEYSAPSEVFGEYYIAAYLDVDPNDGVAMNLELDPMHLPDVMTEIVDGETTIVDFTLIDDAWNVTDDDDDDDTIDDDDDTTDDDDDDVTQVAGTISYSGSETGDVVVVSFYDYWPPMGPPKHFFEVNVPDDKSMSFEYEIPVDFTGDKWRIIAYLDVDSSDTGYNSDLDPSDMDNTKHTITEGQTTTRNFTLVDP